MTPATLNQSVATLIDADTTTIVITAATPRPTGAHPPASVYARYYWLPTIGATPLLMWDRFCEYLTTADPGKEIVLDWPELTRSLGSTPGRAARSLSRLIEFRFVTPTPTGMAVHTHAPNLSPAQLRRLAVHCPTLTAADDQYATPITV